MDVFIPTIEVTPEVLKALEVEGYLEIVSNGDSEGDELWRMFSKISVASNITSLRQKCEDGEKDAENLLKHNYIAAEEMRVFFDKKQFQYYTKRIEPRRKRGPINVQPTNYDIKYKSFTVGDNKPLNDGVIHQQVGIRLVVDIWGSSSNDPSIVMEFSSFQVSVCEDQFHNGGDDDVCHGYFPAKVTLTVKPKTTMSRITPEYYKPNRDQFLGNDSQVSRTNTQEGTAKATFKLACVDTKIGGTLTEAQTSSLKSTRVVVVNLGDHDNAHVLWKIVTLGEEHRSFDIKHPHKAMNRGKFPKLPFESGTGPVITDMPGIKWNCSDADLIEKLKFDVNIKAEMVLLQKDPNGINLCGLGPKGFCTSSRKVTVEHDELINVEPLPVRTHHLDRRDNMPAS